MAAGAVDDTGRNLAQWLREIARGPRACPAPRAPAPQPSEKVLEHLEAQVGRELRSREAIDDLVQDLESLPRRERDRGTRRGILRGTLLLALLLAAFLNYYYWSVKLEVASLPGVQVFVPISR